MGSMEGEEWGEEIREEGERVENNREVDGGEDLVVYFYFLLPWRELTVISNCL